MKRLIATVSFAALAVPAFAQSWDRSPTDPIMPAFHDTPGLERSQVASSGATRSDVEIAVEAGAGSEGLGRHVERSRGYFDPSQ